MDKRLGGALPPLASDAPLLDCLEIHGGRVYEVTFAVPIIAGIYVHWQPAANGADKGRSVLCTGDCDCRWHETLALPSWRGYAAVMVNGKGVPLLLTLAQAGAVRLLAKLPPAAPLTGQRVGVGREGKGHRGALYFQDSHHAPHVLPSKPVDIWPTLARMYGTDVYRYHPRHQQEGGQ